MENPLEVAWAGCKLGGVGSQGITRAGQPVLARLMETQLWYPPMPACQQGGGLNKGTMDSANTSVWEKVAPPALALKPDNSVPPRMSLACFKLLPQHWSSEQMSPSVSKSACRPFKRNVCDSCSSLFHSPTVSCWFSWPEVVQTSWY